MGPRHLTGDKCEGPIAPAVPFEPVRLDKHGMGDAAPFAHRPRAGLQRNRRCGLLRVACLRVEVQASQLSQVPRFRVSAIDSFHEYKHLAFAPGTVRARPPAVAMGCIF
jgi:hypothetical protein